MARALPPTNLTPTDELRSLLERLERLLPSLRGKGENAIDLLDWMDRIHELVPELQEGGADLRPELSRLGTVEATLQDKAGIMAREVGSKLAQARTEAKATPERWWWYVDDIARQRRIQQLGRAGMYGVVTIAIILFVLVGIPRIFPVDPAVVASQRFSHQAEAAMQEGDVETALAAYQSAVEALPDDPVYQIRVGVLSETMGDTARAEAAYVTARTLTDDDVKFYVLRSQAFLQTDNGEAALADADQAVAMDPDSVEGYFQRGSSLDMLGRLTEAIQAFQTASDLAEDTNPQMAVLARVRMGYLIQSAPLYSPPETPTTSP